MAHLNSASRKSRADAPTASVVSKALLSLTMLCLSFTTVGVAQASENFAAKNSAAENFAAKKFKVEHSANRTFGKESATKDLSVLEDGTYLFGQSPQRNQIGTSYAIFSINDSRAVGAFYQPSSSFDCFSGQVYPDRMALDVVDSYRQTVHPYAIALTTDGSLTAGSAAPAYTLQGFHRIEDLSEQDLEILATCEADLN